MARDNPQIKDMELAGSDSAEVLSDEQSMAMRVPYRRVLAVGVGLLAVAACSAVAFVGGSDTRTVSDGSLTGLTLLDHADVHAVVADNVRKTRLDMLGLDSDEAEMRRLVAHHFQNISQQIKEKSPGRYRELAATPITEDQKRAVVHATGYLSDKRVQRLGVKVARAVGSAKTSDHEQLKRHVAKSMAPHFAEMQHLRNEIFPDPKMRELLGTGNGDSLENILRPERVRLMSTVGDGWDVHFSMSMPEHAEVATARRLSLWGSSQPGYQQPAYQQPPSGYQQPPPASNSYTYGSSQGTTTDIPLGESEISIGMIAAILEEADTVMRIIRPLTKLFGKDLNIDPKLTSGIGLFDYIFQLASCELNAATDDEDPIEVAGCPLEFGSEAMDALREVFTLLGILGDNDPTNGEQGNHDGEATTHEGVLNDKNNMLGFLS